MFVAEEALKQLQNELTYSDVCDEIMLQYECGMISLEDANYISEAAAEKYMCEKAKLNPMKHYLEKLKKIKDQKPNEYDGPKDVKEWVDKYYDDLVEAADILEKEPKNMNKSDIKAVVSFLVSAIIATIGVAFEAGFFFVLLGFISYVGIIVYVIIRACREQKDYDANSELKKIKDALIRLKRKKLDNKTNRKVSKIIQKISDANLEIKDYKDSKPQTVIAYSI